MSPVHANKRCPDLVPCSLGNRRRRSMAEEGGSFAHEAKNVQSFALPPAFLSLPRRLLSHGTFGFFCAV